MNSVVSMILQWLTIALGFGALFWMAMNGHASWDMLTATLYTGLGFLMRHAAAALGAKPGELVLPPVPAASVAAPPAPPAVAGRSLLSFLSFAIFCGLAIAAALAMSGCTTTTASLYRGYMTEAQAGIQAFDDNAIATNRAIFCAQPYSAIQRHPEIQAGVDVLCGPLAGAAKLDANQLQLLMNLMNASGVKLQAAPAGAK